ncbi:hypothetical protein EDI_203940 [Entamoeba dispar SAW760]|uniref:Uncharacterized protein n=1 Tax=Entamoeba dispar (strain ATCC PRA-260 / SAW760) TaxID=370354 RepID=B0ESI8_ENTDS|nr:uncharacterized protein EDI_203940 [Entamoeba dispar SAW760]EDR22482.1 hypothetical protein EDI_203940 [Entamoeba dispar SAW760]|eukprot:EDR22482.1 hypothetical protein EDI_203940 [Entamoeba dispar SAW760]
MSIISNDKFSDVISKERKIISRNVESGITNTVICILIKQLGAIVSFRRTKKTKNTVKMMIPESITIIGTVIDQNNLIEMSDLLIREMIKEQPINREGMSDKQYNRSKESWINNGLLYLLKMYGYNFNIRQTKKAKLTERFVKVSSISLPSGEIINEKRLIEIGMEFEQFISNSFKREKVLKVDSSQLSSLHIPEITDILVNQQCLSYCSFNEQQPTTGSIVVEYQPLFYTQDIGIPGTIYPLRYDNNYFLWFLQKNQMKQTVVVIPTNHKVIRVHSGFHNEYILNQLKNEYHIIDSPILSHDILLPNNINIDIVDADSIISDADYTTLIQRRKYLKDTDFVIFFLKSSFNSSLIQRLQFDLSPSSSFLFIPIEDDDLLLMNCINSILKSNVEPFHNDEINFADEIKSFASQLSSLINVDVYSLMKTNHLSISDLFNSSLLLSKGINEDIVQSLQQLFSTDRFLYFFVLINNLK